MSDRFLRNVFQRTLRDQQRGLVGFGVGIVAYALFIGSFYPTVRDQQEQFNKLLDSYPPAMKAAFGISDLGSAPGFVHAELFSVMVPLLFLLYAIARAADVVAGEEERGSLDVLLTHPVARGRAFASKAAGLAAGLAILALLLFASLVVANATVGMGIGLAPLAEEVLLLLLLAFAMAGVTFLVAGFRGRKGAAVAIASGVAVAAYLLHSFGGLVDALSGARRLSPFYYYAESPPLVAPFHPLDALVLALLGVAGVAVGWWAFQRRDLGV